MKQFQVSLNTAKRVRFFQTDDPSVIVTLTETIKPVKVSGITTYVVTGEVQARKTVPGKSCENQCAAEFPAIISMRYSAPAGTDVKALWDLMILKGKAKSGVLLPGIAASNFEANI